ncbi:MgtC/SapB family protein [Sphingopyxis sp.]|uniref:MgtC/SapB family protein n=1 Tax=Sphingopyxis sp. TaxID=1908224 RepID=UPI003BA9CD97
MTQPPLLDQWPLLSGLGVSLGLGLLMGVQRGWTLRREAAGSRFAGIRTFGLLGLSGGIAGTIQSIDRIAAGVLLASAALLLMLGYARSVRETGRISGTNALAGLVTLGCGFLAASGSPQGAAIIAVSATMLLTLRPQLHRWIKGMTETEVSAVARFALIALVVVPLLPDHRLGPFEAWNPRQLGMVVVFVSGFSFAGYLASRRFGATRGTLLMAATGAMVSSTAVTAALATRLRDDRENVPVLVAGIAAASTVMLIRVILLVALLAPIALPALSLLLAPAALVSLAAMIWGLLAGRHAGVPEASPVALRNPLNLVTALVLTALVMAMAVAARWLIERVGEAGLAAVLALSGIADVDAAIITIGGLPAGLLDSRTAGLVVAAPVMANTMFKAAVAVAIVRTRRGLLAALPLVASVAAGGAMVAFLR